MSDIVNDLATITTFPVASINKILSRYQDCICYNLQQNLDKIEESVALDIYIGVIILQLNNNEVKYKFIPSASFEKDIVNTINNGESPLVGKLEDLIADKITEAYKEFF